MIRLFWWKYESNFGDDLSPVICRHLSRDEIVFSRPRGSDLVAIGSLLESVHRLWRYGRLLDWLPGQGEVRPKKPVFAGKAGRTVDVLSGMLDKSLQLSYCCQYPGMIWGTGFLAKKFRGVSYPRARILAVRGKKTRDLLQLTDDLPVGDPGLLVNLLVRPKPKRFKFGIIPHYVDNRNPAVLKHQSNPHVKIIDVSSGYQRILEEIVQCEIIGSSCLHGLIAADALQIPNVWLRLSHSVSGAEFKFRDYYSIFCMENTQPMIVGTDLDLTWLESATEDYNRPQLERLRGELIRAFPHPSTARHHYSGSDTAGSLTKLT